MKMADSGCIYGPTGSYKTTAIAHLANYIAETTGKKTLLFSSDGGGWKSAQEEVDAGMISPYRCDSATIPLPIIRRISYGYWPENPDETDVSRVNFRPIDWTEYGGIAVEGLTSISTMLMRHLADKAIKTGEEATSKFSMGIRVNGEVVNETFAGNSKGHYGFVQSQLYGMVMNFISLPVKYVLFTAHESKTEDDDRSTIYGPAIAGKKATALVGSWVGDLIHAQDFAVPRMVKATNPAKPCRANRHGDRGHGMPVLLQEASGPGHRDHVPSQAARDPLVRSRRWKSCIREGSSFPNATSGFDDYLRNVDRVGQEAGQKSQRCRPGARSKTQKLGRSKPAAAAKV
jgi:hypothetical protein